MSSLTPLIGALATCFNKRPGIVKWNIQDADIEVWGKVKSTDSDAGDTIRASEVGKIRDDHRDASFVRYEMLVDQHAHRWDVQPEFMPETFYGQLQWIYLMHSNPPCSELNLSQPMTTIIMAQIRECKITSESIPHLDIHFYTSTGQTHVTDITSVQCVVGRVPCSMGAWQEWGVIDRSGTLGRAIFLEDDTGNFDN
ncbi:hypothetical protein EV368DRAFT_87714 [Lentinula lateritia]|nr:hypothetical protein EV368DRAFT_87714 [Lentinula lateritia]